MTRSVRLSSMTSEPPAERHCLRHCERYLRHPDGATARRGHLEGQSRRAISKGNLEVGEQPCVPSPMGRVVQPLTGIARELWGKPLRQARGVLSARLSAGAAADTLPALLRTTGRPFHTGKRSRKASPCESLQAPTSRVFMATVEKQMDMFDFGECSVFRRSLDGI